jgi:hypothetical protein
MSESPRDRLSRNYRMFILFMTGVTYNVRSAWDSTIRNVVSQANYQFHSWDLISESYPLKFGALIG